MKDGSSKGNIKAIFMLLGVLFIIFKIMNYGRDDDKLQSAGILRTAGKKTDVMDESSYAMDKSLQLVCITDYTYDRKGNCTEKRQYGILDSNPNAGIILCSRERAGYDKRGNCVYQKRETADGETEEVFYLYQYDETGRIANQSVWQDGSLMEVRDLRYQEDGGSVCIIRECIDGEPQDDSSYVILADKDGKELMTGTYDSVTQRVVYEKGGRRILSSAFMEGKIYSGQGEYYNGLQRPDSSLMEEIREEIRDDGAHEEIGYTEDFLAYYSWSYNDKSGLPKCGVEILPVLEDGRIRYEVLFVCCEYNDTGLLIKESIYRIKGKFHQYSKDYYGDYDGMVYVVFDGNGRLLYLGSAYFPIPEGAGEEIYRIRFGEDGSFKEVWQ